MYYCCVFAIFHYVEAWVNSYVETIYPVGNEDDWVVPDEIKQIKVLKPLYRTKDGRSKTNRRPSQGEKKKALRYCSSCRGQCHNCSTYKYTMPPPSTISGSDIRSSAQQIQI